MKQESSGETHSAFLLPKSIPEFQLTYVFFFKKIKTIANKVKYKDPEKIN